MKELGIWILVFISVNGLFLLWAYLEEKYGQPCPVAGPEALLFALLFTMIFAFAAPIRFIWLLISAWF